MAIISFAKTVDEFMSGKKTVTRRDWSDAHFIMWRHFWITGCLVHDAYDKLPFEVIWTGKKNIYRKGKETLY